MYFLIYHVRPSNENFEKDRLKGAYVSCWIESASIEQAKKIAEKEIRSENWDVIELDEGYEIERKDYDEYSGQSGANRQMGLRVHTYPYE